MSLVIAVLSVLNIYFAPVRASPMDVRLPCLSLHDLLSAISTTVICVSLVLIARTTEQLAVNSAKSQILLVEQIGILRGACGARTPTGEPLIKKARLQKGGAAV